MVANKKILMFLMLGIFMISFGSAALTDNILSYYKLDETSGTNAYDSLGIMNLSESGTSSIPNQVGIIDKSWFFAADTDHLQSSINTGISGTASRTVSTWFNLGDENVITMFGIGVGSTNNEFALQADIGRLYFVGYSNDLDMTSTTSHIVNNTWYHAVTTYDGTTLRVYLDGVNVGNKTTAFATTNNKMRIGRRDGAGVSGDGRVDETGVWNRALSHAEVLQLYNGGAGLTYPFITGQNPVVVLNSPEDSYFSTSNTVNFNVTVTDDLQVENVTLYIDGVANETNSSGFNGTYIFTKYLSEGPHNWSILAYDNESRSTQSSTRDLEVDTFQPNITIYEPVGLIEYLAVGDNLTLNATIEDPNLAECWFEYNNTETLTNSTFDDSTFLGEWEYPSNYANVTEITDGTTTLVDIPETCSRAGNFTLAVQTSGLFNYAWQCLDEFGSYQTISIEPLQHQATPTITSMVRRPLNCSDSVEDFEYVEGENSLCVHAIDTGGLHRENVTSWNFEFLETNRTFDAVALQTGTETFVLEGIKQSSTTAISAVLTYNGGNYSVLKTGSGNNVVFTSVIGIPTYLTGNIDFFWTVSYTNSTGTYSFVTSNSTQQVFALSLEECFAPSVDGLTLNFTTYDSTNLTALESTFEATFQFYAESGSGSMIVEYLFSDLNENRSNYMFCLNSSGQNVTLDAFISYDATNFDRREYILDDAIIGNFTQSIPLFLTETDLTDIVTITVQDQSYDPIAGALVNVQTWNVGTNTYATIGMLTTSSSGQGIIDLELYTTWYRSVVSIGGDIVEVTDVQKLSGTSWIITVALEEDNPYDLFGDILYGLTFDNSTNITSFTWVDTSGYTEEGCMVVKNNTNLGPVTIFDSCVESVSGTIDYLISGDGDYSVYGVIFLEGYDASQIVDTLNIRLGTPPITETVSPYGKVITFLMVGVAGAIGVAAGSIVLGGFLLVAVLFGAIKFGFLNMTWGFVWGIVSILLIAIFIQKRRRG